METRIETTVTYLHRYEYRERNKDGTWTPPEIRYHNVTSSENVARKRHQSCKDTEYTWNREFEGSWGYSWKNCELVRRTEVVVVQEEAI